MSFKTDFSDGKTVLLIINPKAGRTTSQLKAELILKAFERYGFVPTVYYTERKGHATELAAEYADKYDITVCVGGDGTLDETVSGLLKLEKRPLLGYIPGGTTNDFAKTMKLPRFPDQAVAVMAKGKTRSVDCGDFNGRSFIYVASFGAFTEVSYSTPQEIKNFLGRGAYFLDGIQSVFDIRPYHVRITTDSAVYEDDFIYGGVSNTYSVGGVINFPKESVNLSDGKLELMLVKNVENPEELPDTVRACFDMNYENDNVIITKSSYVKMEFEEDVAFTCDGEYSGSFKTVQIKCITPGYELLVP